MNTQQDPLIGTRLDGRYLIDRLVGTGGMARVYKATDETLGRAVAIKLLNARHAHDEAFVERFMREASAAAKLNHPNIVQVYDRGEAENSYYIAMEYVDGVTLKDLIRSRGALPESESIAYGEQALNALRFAHRNGIVHRDIKPHNMMVDTEGRLKIADFGIARAGSDSGLTEVGSIVGTAQYLSPEQAQGHTVNAPSDLYSMGVVLFEMVTGRVPFEGESPVNVALRHVNDPVPSPRSARSGVSSAMEAVVLRALQKDPQARYASADEMLDDLGKVMSGDVSEQTTSVLVGAAVSSAAAATSSMQTSVQPVLPAIPMDASSSYAEATSFGLEPEPEPEQERRSRWWLWLVLLAVLAAGAAAWLLLKSSPEPATTTVRVPDVVGLTQDEAESRLEKANLRVGTVTFESSDSAEKDEVLEQDPGSDEKVDERSKIDLVVSSGPELSAMPRLTGRTEDEARQLLRSQGITRVSTTEEFSDTVEEGRVISQDPAEGSDVSKDTSITLTVSKGPENTTVPDVIGDEYAAAKSELESAGFEVTRQEADSEQAKNTVLNQSVPAGQKAKTGSTIVLTVASGFNAVPNVVGMNRDEAETAIQDAGFAVQIGTDTEDPAMTPGDPDIVSTQSPAPSRRQLGSTVTINIKHAPPGP